MGADEKRRLIIQKMPEDLRPFMNILLDRAAMLERQMPEDHFLGYYEDVLDLSWRHLGRPKDVEASPKPYDKSPDGPPKGESERRQRPFNTDRSGML